jgi:hypothetical protein
VSGLFFPLQPPNPPDCGKESGGRELNPRHQLGRLRLYR